MALRCASVASVAGVQPPASNASDSLSLGCVAALDVLRGCIPAPPLGEMPLQLVLRVATGRHAGSQRLWPP